MKVCLKEKGIANICLFKDWDDNSLKVGCRDDFRIAEKEQTIENILKECDAPVKKLLTFEHTRNNCLAFTGLIRLKCLAIVRQKTL